MATTQHYLWAGGHFVLLISALRYFLATVTFKAVPSWWYKVSFTGALISYVIVCQKSLGVSVTRMYDLGRAKLLRN